VIHSRVSRSHGETGNTRQKKKKRERERERNQERSFSRRATWPEMKPQSGMSQRFFTGERENGLLKKKKKKKGRIRPAPSNTRRRGGPAGGTARGVRGRTGSAQAAGRRDVPFFFSFFLLKHRQQYGSNGGIAVSCGDAPLRRVINCARANSWRSHVGRKDRSPSSRQSTRERLNFTLRRYSCD